MRNWSSKRSVVSFHLPLTARDEEVARDKNHQITVNRVFIVRVLGMIAIILVLASVAGQCTKFLRPNESVYGLIGLFDIDGEANVPSYFSASLLLLAAFLLSIISILKRKSRAPFALHWTILAFTFLYLAVDEAAGIHELLMKPTEELLGTHLTTGIFYFAWVIPGMAVTLVFALSFLVFFLYLPTPVRSVVLVAAILYIGGAIGMELLGGWYVEHREIDLTFNMIATLEESLEMAGAIVFIHALMTYIEVNYPEVRFRFEHSTETAKPPRSWTAE